MENNDIVSKVRAEVHAMQADLNARYGPGYRINLLVQVNNGFLTAEEYIHKAIDAVCEVFDITVENLKSKSRKSHLVDARAVAISLIMKNNPTVTCAAVGQVFKKEHSTVVFMRKRANNMLAIGDKKFLTKYNAVLQKIEEYARAAAQVQVKG